MKEISGGSDLGVKDWVIEQTLERARRDLEADEPGCEERLAQARKREEAIRQQRPFLQGLYTDLRNEACNTTLQFNSNAAFAFNKFHPFTLYNSRARLWPVFGPACLQSKCFI